MIIIVSVILLIPIVFMFFFNTFGRIIDTLSFKFG